MKRIFEFRKVLSLFMAMVFLMSFVSVYAFGGYGKGFVNSNGDIDRTIHFDLIEDNATLSQEEIDSLIKMREEEKLARDVYLTLYDKWGLQVFNNIAKSEETHTLAVKDLLDLYNVEDPVVDDTVGVFTNPEFSELYSQLVSQGEESVVSALKVGATIEDLDIKDLEDDMKLTDNQNILLVYKNLKQGSYNHMRAFVGQLENYNETYEPQYISIEEFNYILETPMGHGNMNSGKNVESNVNDFRGRGMVNANVNGVEHGLLFFKNYNGKFSEDTKKFSYSFEKNYNEALEYKNKIENRGFFSKVFFGGDRESAEKILEKVNENEKLIVELKSKLLNSSDVEAQVILEQIRLLEEENNVLKQLALEEKNKKGLFRWW